MKPLFDAFGWLVIGAVIPVIAYLVLLAIFL